MNCSKTLVRLILAAALLLAAAGVPAAVMRRMPVRELAEKSDLIIHGYVLAETCHGDPDGGIYTSIDVKVGEVWKGALQTNVLTVVQGGGTFGGVRLEVSGQAEYTRGEEVVLFLAINPMGEVVTLGLSQGKFHVWKDDSSGTTVADNPEPAEMEPEADSPAAGPKPAPLPIQELKKEVQGIRP